MDTCRTLSCPAVVCHAGEGCAGGRHHGGHGFSLIEVLVAVIVLALGLIGGAALQLSALRTRHQSALMSTAVQLASSMADRMRANLVQLQADDASNLYLTARHDATRDPAPAPPDQACLATPCNSAQLARADIHELIEQVRDSFPGGRLLICRDTLTWNAAAHALEWDCDGSAASPMVIKLGWRTKQPDGSAAGSTDQQQGPAVAVSVTTAVR